MEQNELADQRPVLVAGDNRLVYSISVCLLQAGHTVVLYTRDKKKARQQIDIHLRDLGEAGHPIDGTGTLEIADETDNAVHFSVVVAVTGEDAGDKKTLIRTIEQEVSPETAIAINTESISLAALQESASYPERIVGLNWVEPAHTTFFLELITNSAAQEPHIEEIYYLAKKHWHKDPYIVRGNYGIRSRLFAAMAREAFYLVQHGYASVEDIDRACRNDAGYYLPFAGNCRYMDLMGTYAYGMVMKELNPDLSTSSDTPEFFNEIVSKGGKGMESGAGFYSYRDGEAGRWGRLFREFSYRMGRIIEKYPFGNHAGFTADHQGSTHEEK